MGKQAEISSSCTEKKCNNTIDIHAAKAKKAEVTSIGHTFVEAK